MKRVHTSIAFGALDGELDLVLGRYVLPRGQEHLLLHVAILAEVHVGWDDGGKVEDVDVILNGHLQVGQGLHFGHLSSRVQGQGNVDRLIRRNRGDVQGLGWGQSEAVLVELDSKPVHGLHGLIGQRHVHIDGAIFP